MAVLPPRPLPLDPRAISVRRRKHLLLCAFVVAVALAFNAGAVFSIRELLDEHALWKRGVEGRLVDYSGKVVQTSKLGLTFFYDYRLKVHWVDAQGRAHQGNTSFERMFTAVPKGQDPSLRYDPQAPD